jgi:hypothetical protein
LAIEVAFVTGGDETTGGGEILFAPGAQLHPGRQWFGRCGQQVGAPQAGKRRRQISFHEQAGKYLEAGAGEDRGVRRVRMKEQLRFDAFDARGVNEQFDKMIE